MPGLEDRYMIQLTVQELENLIQNNPNTTFYINAVIPRTLPDVRAYNWGNGTYKNILGKTTSYIQAFSEFSVRNIRKIKKSYLICKFQKMQS